MAERTIPIEKENLARVFDDDEAVTFEFDHAASVTLVAEKNRRKWEEHDRPEQSGDVFFLSSDDRQQIKYSTTGMSFENGVRLIRKASIDNNQ